MVVVEEVLIVVVAVVVCIVHGSSIYRSVLGGDFELILDPCKPLDDLSVLALVSFQLNYFIDYFIDFAFSGNEAPPGEGLHSPPALLQANLSFSAALETGVARLSFFS